MAVTYPKPHVSHCGTCGARGTVDVDHATRRATGAFWHSGTGSSVCDPEVFRALCADTTPMPYAERKALFAAQVRQGRATPEDIAATAAWQAEYDAVLHAEASRLHAIEQAERQAAWEARRAAYRAWRESHPEGTWREWATTEAGKASTLRALA